MNPAAASTLARSLATVVLAVPGLVVAATPCDLLLTAQVDASRVLSSIAVESRDELPAHCRVRGVIVPAINFELRLPIEDWNGKFYMVGCDDSAGGSTSSARDSPIR
jgi:hypothetical protein